MPCPGIGLLLVVGDGSPRPSLLNFTLTIEAAAIRFGLSSEAVTLRNSIAMHFRRRILIAYRLGAGSRSTPE